MSIDSEERIERRLAEMNQTLREHMGEIRDDLIEVKSDVKALNREAIPFRVGALEKWRDSLSTRLWTFLIGFGVVTASAWMAVVYQSNP